ncbi:hypothetical protein ABZ958_03315 [Streptomyces sp. NPDC046237]|uniref:hypothetical protein n=1 Tax=Streptomyces sp. NPDC046237 TaxID=3154914 RepID=UPI0033CDC232
MAATTPRRIDTRHPSTLRKLDRAAAAHAKTRQALEEAICEAREDGFPLTTVAEHSGFSREWVRKITARNAAAGDISEHASESSPNDT